MSISIKGFNEEFITLYCDEADLSVGDFATVTSSFTVSTATSGSGFAGIVDSISDGYAVVQVKGYLESACDDTVVVGCHRLSADGSTLTLDEESGREALVMSVEDNVAAIII